MGLPWAYATLDLLQGRGQGTTLPSPRWGSCPPSPHTAHGTPQPLPSQWLPPCWVQAGRRVWATWAALSSLSPPPSPSPFQKADGREEPTGQWPLSAPLTGQGCLPALGDLCFREEPWGTLSGAVFCTCGQDVAWQQAASGAALGQVTGERGARPPHPSPAHPCALVLLVTPGQRTVHPSDRLGGSQAPTAFTPEGGGGSQGHRGQGRWEAGSKLGPQCPPVRAQTGHRPCRPPHCPGAAHALLLLFAEPCFTLFKPGSLLSHIQVCVPGLGGQAHVCVSTMHTCVSSAGTRIHAHLTTPALTRLPIRGTAGLRQKGTPPLSTGTAPRAGVPHPPPQRGPGTCMFSKRLGAPGTSGEPRVPGVCLQLPPSRRLGAVVEGCSQRRPSGPRAGGDVRPERVGQGRARRPKPGSSRWGPELWPWGPGAPWCLPRGVQQEGRQEQLRAKTPLGACTPDRSPPGVPD